MNLLKICFGWLKQSWTWLRWPVAIGILVYLFFLYHEQFYDLVQREIDYAYLALAFVLQHSRTFLAQFHRNYTRQPLPAPAQS